jgi:hypothetical protein
MKMFFAKNKIAQEPPSNVQCCIACVHFHNSPEYMERVYPGLNTLSSGNASVRKDDGICTLHDLYLSANAHCEQFAPEGGTSKIVK